MIDHLPVLTEDPDLLITDLDYDLNGFEFTESDSVIVLTKGERDVPTLEVLSKKQGEVRRAPRQPPEGRRTTSSSSEGEVSPPPS